MVEQKFRHSVSHTHYNNIFKLFFSLALFCRINLSYLIPLYSHFSTSRIIPLFALCRVTREIVRFFPLFVPFRIIRGIVRFFPCFRRTGLQLVSVESCRVSSVALLLAPPTRWGEECCRHSESSVQASHGWGAWLRSRGYRKRSLVRALPLVFASLFKLAFQRRLINVGMIVSA